MYQNVPQMCSGRVSVCGDSEASWGKQGHTTALGFGPDRNAQRERAVFPSESLTAAANAATAEKSAHFSQ